MTGKIVTALLTVAFLGLAACHGHGPADVKQVVSSPSGSLHAAVLFQYGSAIDGTTVFVSIFRGEAPRVGSTVQVEDQCWVFSGYKTGPWKVTWEGETQLDLAIDGHRSYEGMNKGRECEGVRARWSYQKEPSP